MNICQKKLNRLVKADIRFSEEFYPKRLNSYRQHKMYIKDHLNHLGGVNIKNIDSLIGYIRCAF